MLYLRFNSFAGFSVQGELREGAGVGGGVSEAKWMQK